MLQALPQLAAAAAVVVEPVGPADWEVVELNAGLLEEHVLGQVRQVDPCCVDTAVVTYKERGLQSCVLIMLAPFASENKARRNTEARPP
jgi:hypothetical protein